MKIKDLEASILAIDQNQQNASAVFVVVRQTIALLADAKTKERGPILIRIYDQRFQMEPSLQSLLCNHIHAYFQEQWTWVLVLLKHWLTINCPASTTSGGDECGPIMQHS